jgi:hypothetical protein
MFSFPKEVNLTDIKTVTSGITINNSQTLVTVLEDEDRRDLTSVGNIPYTLILLINWGHIRNTQTILCTLNIQLRLISNSCT